MTNHVGRLYAISLALFVFFLTWATVAAHPWSARATPRADPRAAALAARQLQLRRGASWSRASSAGAGRSTKSSCVGVSSKSLW